MKILKVTGGFIPAEKQGGTAVVGHALCKYLAKVGHDVKVFTTNINGDEFLDVEDEWKSFDNMDVFYAKATKTLFPYYSPSMIREFEKNIEEADVVLMASVWTWYGPKIAKICKKYNVPYILYPHGVRSYDRMKMQGYAKKVLWWYFFDKPMFFNADGLVAITEFEKKEMKSIGVECPIEVIANGVEPLETVSNPRSILKKEYGIEENKDIIFFIGRIELIKGVDLAIESIKLVLDKNPNTVLVLAGPDRENLTEELSQLSNKLGIKDNVIFTGAIKGDIRLALYQSSKVLILPSITEVLAMAVLEGLKSGLPVVVTDKDAFVDVVSYDAGYACDRNKESISECINKLLTNDTLYNTMSKNALKLASDKYTWEGIAKDTTTYISKVIKGL